MKEFNSIKEESNILNMENVWVAFNGIPVLENINLSVYRNDFLGIIGPNGGGKTTLLKVILGLVVPNFGEISFLGEDPRFNKKYMGYVPQFLNFDREFPISVWDMVLTGRLGRIGLFRRVKKKDREIVADTLDKVGMYSLKDRQIGQLSGGQIQRALIARALVGEPEMLLLDEPTANLDSNTEKNLYELLSKLNDKIPIILVTHDVSIISSYINKIACLNKKLYCHNTGEITKEMLETAYGSPLELVMHGVPHRFLREHREKMVME